MKHNQNWRQLISPNLDKYFFGERWQFSFSNHQAKTTVERCNHTPLGPPVCPGTKVGWGGLDVAQNQFLLCVGCFSKITTEKYVERLEMKLCKYDSFLIWQKWTLCEERRTTRIVKLIHVVNAFPFHYYYFLVSMCDTKREPLKQQFLSDNDVISRTLTNNDISLLFGKTVNFLLQTIIADSSPY